MKESPRISAANTYSQTIGDLVARDYRAASVFEKYGIDFCCGGQVLLGTACREKGIDPEELLRELDKAADRPIDRSQNFDAWELPFLADFIVNTHHAYLKENTDSIAANTRKIAQVHGANHPEVIEISAIFEKMAAELALHLRQEEELLFPAIKKMVALEKGGSGPGTRDREALKAELTALTHEHDGIGAAIHEIRRLANDYALPGDACNTFMVTYRKLKEFEDDLHKHVHLENNILFPKAARL